MSINQYNWPKAHLALAVSIVAELSDELGDRGPLVKEVLASLRVIRKLSKATKMTKGVMDALPRAFQALETINHSAYRLNEVASWPEMESLQDTISALLGPLFRYVKTGLDREIQGESAVRLVVRFMLACNHIVVTFPTETNFSKPARRTIDLCLSNQDRATEIVTNGDFDSPIQLHFIY